MTDPFAIYIYLALQKKSKIDNPINREEIQQYIKENFNTDISLKTITDNIKAMDTKCSKFISIKHQGNNGYYLENNGTNFTLGQITFLMDATFSSKDISTEDAAKINNQLLDLLDDDNIKSLKKVADHVLKPTVNGQSKTIANNIFENEEVIVKNIEHNHKIRFEHKSFPEFRMMSPYYVFSKNGHYYVIGSVLGEIKNIISEKRFEYQLYVFRVDHLTNVKGTREKRDPLDQNGINGRLFNLNRYISQRNNIEEGIVDMATKSATLIFKERSTYYALLDTFGENITIMEKAGQYEAVVKNDEKAIVDFAFEHARDIEVVKPTNIRTKLIQLSKAIVNKYKEVEPSPREA